MVPPQIPDPQAWGIDLGYNGYDGQWRDVAPASVDRLLAAMGAQSTRPDQGQERVWVITEGEQPHIDGSWRLQLEDGTERSGSGSLPSDIALGYHQLFHSGRAEAVRLIVAPDACQRLDERQWGWALQLYALRSQNSWGMGDLGDLARFGQLAAAQGASWLVVNPLHAAMPGVPQDTSPYFPSSREFRNLLYLDMDAVAALSNTGAASTLDATERSALNASALIDRDAIWQAKSKALEAIFDASAPSEAFTAFVEAEGESLVRFAAYNALAEKHGSNWTQWPEELRHPASPAVGEFIAAHSNRIAFHQWVQWQLDVQLQAAGRDVGLIQDLAIGVNPSGADAWIWQDAMALGVRVGAPPDEFNTRGQDWGLPPFDPWKLRELQFEPFIRVVRAGLRHARGLRIDHVMGLFRLYWIPEGASASEGTYVRYPWKEMLAIVALESHRAGAYVVGEDLGTIEAFMREELSRQNILSYRLLWFEDNLPSTYPQQSLAAITTHDLPTVAGLLSGEDLETQQRLAMAPNVEATNGIVERVQEWLKLEETASDPERVLAATELLATAPSVMIAATVEDGLGLRYRPNYPGTTVEYPNWSVPLPTQLEELFTNELFVGTARALQLSADTSVKEKSDAS